jgi:hypothetical protein
MKARVPIFERWSQSTHALEKLRRNHIRKLEDLYRASRSRDTRPSIREVRTLMHSSAGRRIPIADATCDWSFALGGQF